MMWWAMWCAVVVVGSASAAAAPVPDSLAPIDYVQMDSSVPDDESLGYAAPAMGGRYMVGAPWIYLADTPRDSQVGSEAMRARRSLSVYPAVDQLQRDAYNRYITRVVAGNRSYLKQIGKRDPRNYY